MTRFSIRMVRWAVHSTAAALVGLATVTVPASTVAQETPAVETSAIRTDPVKTAEVGDLVFIRIDVKPFREVAASTRSWTNHVGIVIGRDSRGPVVAESTFPLSRTTPLSNFVQRSQDGRVAVMRMDVALDTAAQSRLKAAAMRRTGILYDTGFDLRSRRQFCSRFVHEVIEEAVGVRVGEVQTLAQLLGQNPQANVGFWRLWYLGNIPWERQTITPASMLSSPRLKSVFDGKVAVNAGLKGE